MNPAHPNDTITTEIIIQAPAERIFLRLTDPRQRVQWWGAEGKFQATHMESDLRPGGAWLMRGIGMGGKPFTVRGEYRAVERPSLLECTWLADWEDNALPSIVRFDLTEKDGYTTVRLTHSGLTSERSRENYRGWPWILSMLQAYVTQKAST